MFAGRGLGSLAVPFRDDEHLETHLEELPDLTKRLVEQLKYIKSESSTGLGALELSKTKVKYCLEGSFSATFSASPTLQG